MSCILLYALGGFTINESEASDLQTAPINVHQIDVPFKDSSQISTTPEETKGMSFIGVLYEK